MTLEGNKNLDLAPRGPARAVDPLQPAGKLQELHLFHLISARLALTKSCNRAREPKVLWNILEQCFRSQEVTISSFHLLGAGRKATSWMKILVPNYSQSSGSSKFVFLGLYICQTRFNSLFSVFMLV